MKLELQNIAATMPSVVPSAEDGVWILERPVSIWLNTNRGQVKLSLAAGFATNFRSGWDGINFIIPKAVLGQGLTYTVAILAHDAAYTAPHPFTKTVADDLLVQAARLSGMGGIKAWLMRASLSMFGECAWDEPAEGVYGRNAERIRWRVPRGFA